MTLTNNDLSQRVLQAIGHVQEGGNGEPWHTQRALEIIAEKHASLREADIAYWPNDAVPMRVAFALVEYLAAVSWQRLAADPYPMSEREAHRKLCASAHRPDVAGQTVQAEYF